jgi:hypothetical protein
MAYCNSGMFNPNPIAKDFTWSSSCSSMFWYRIWTNVDFRHGLASIARTNDQAQAFGMGIFAVQNAKGSPLPSGPFVSQ